jgi:hypothetical protein
VGRLTNAPDAGKDGIANRLRAISEGFREQRLQTRFAEFFACRAIGMDISVL